MKNIAYVLIVGLVLVYSAQVGLAQEKPAGPPATPAVGVPKPVETKETPKAATTTVTVAEVKGSVDVRPSADKPWVPATVGMKLASDWEISTGVNGQALLRFEDNSEVLVQRLTEMKISEFSRTPAEVKTRLQMKYGSVRIQVKKGTAANDFRVASPTGTASVQGTKIEEFSYYRGLGGRLRMGNEGTAQYHVNPTMTVGAGQMTNDHLLDPATFAKLAGWVPVNFTGYTPEETKSSFWRGTLGEGVWDKLVSTNPSNSNLNNQSFPPPPPPPPPAGPPKPPEPW